MKNNDLHLELLEKYEVLLDPNGKVYTEGRMIHRDEDVTIGYRDDGPDAWSNSRFFDGPAWIWTEDCGWSAYKNGVNITGYSGLAAKVLTIQEDGLHVTNCYGEAY